MNRSRREEEQRERMPVVIHPDAAIGSTMIARGIRDLMVQNRACGRPTVLGLATGSTPVPVYRELIRMHREEGLSFRDVVTFNLDEYYGLAASHRESYRRFMEEQLFSHLDIRAENIHVPDGTVPRAAVYQWCREYETAIERAGGLDLQILGIGRTGHVGFNEPGSGRESRTRLVTLDTLTRRDAARDFLGEGNVPHHAITMGVGTILAARQIVLLAWGKGKAGIVSRAVEGPVSDALPASFLQEHANVTVHLDPPAAAELTRHRFPWLVGRVEWTDALTLHAVSWLSAWVKKPVLKLTNEDYSEHGLADLLTERGGAHELNLTAFNRLQHTITGWPGGKPDTDDRHRPERAAPACKRVVLFSPEPSDDLVGMGGTLRRLVDHGHQVSIVYLTSGNLGVPDEEAAATIELLRETARYENAACGADAFAAPAESGQPLAGGGDDARRHLKTLVRRSEAREALRAAGIAAHLARFLDLPFYERGRYRQFRPAEADVAAVAAILREMQPHQIFVTGHLADPGSVAAVCFDVFQRAFATLADAVWLSDCRVWLYRDLNNPWEAGEIHMAVPLSPAQLAQKLQAIYRHRSQRSQRPVAAASRRESWQQSEEHNRALAERYDQLGLAEYEALEAFERWSHH